jgi:hypothetical protein
MPGKRRIELTGSGPEVPDTAPPATRRLRDLPGHRT